MRGGEALRAEKRRGVRRTEKGQKKGAENKENETDKIEKNSRCVLVWKPF